MFNAQPGQGLVSRLWTDWALVSMTGRGVLIECVPEGAASACRLAGRRRQSETRGTQLATTDRPSHFSETKLFDGNSHRGLPSPIGAS